MRQLFNRTSLLISFFSIIIFIVILEIITRKTYSLKQEIPANYLALIALEKIPNTDQWINDITTQGVPLPQTYYDYHIHATKPFSTPLVGVTDYFSARRTPASVLLGKSDTIIWVFGGSTTQNLDTPDTLTIMNQLALNLRNNKMPCTVINFGVGGFASSMELTKFTDLLRRVPANERPDKVVFYDGFNEIGCGFYNGAGNTTGNMRAKLGTMINGHYGKLAIYAVSNWLKQHSMLWRKYFSKHVEYKVFDYLTQDPTLTSPENLQKTVDIYVENNKMATAICAAYNIKPYFFLQPMLHTKSVRTPFEQKILDDFGTDWYKFSMDFYTKLPQQMANNPNFYDISNVLNQRKNINDYYDQGHTAPYTPRIIGKKIFEIIR